MAIWTKITSRGNVEDRRAWAPLAGGVGVTGLLIYLLFNVLTGGNADIPLEQLQNIPIQNQQTLGTSNFEGEDDFEVFASTVLGSNNDMWESVFSEMNQVYSPPKLVLFRTTTESACGGASAQTGPHYCPTDSTIYLDETFFDELISRFGAQGGDVAEAYIISHEVAHHAQNQLGIMQQVLQESENGEISNELSIKLELQADCFTGLWVNSIWDLNVIQPGEINEALDAAAAVGDDRVQTIVVGRISPENWTHGSSEQRVGWFNQGYNSGNLEACDTFKQ